MLPAWQSPWIRSAGSGPKRFEGLSDSSDHLFADARILLGERLGYKATVEDPFARLVAEPLDGERRPMRESSGGADRMHARQRAA